MQLPADTRIFGAMKRSFGMVLLALAAAVSPMSGCAPERPPNIVLIVIDTLRADHLSHYGYGRPTAPALDGFAETATLFTDCTSPAPWTVPSVASVMTGLHPARHRLHRMGFALPEDLVTVAEVLQDGGWQTAAASFNPYIRPDFGFDQGFDLFENQSEVLERLRREMDRAISQNEEPQGPKPEDRRHLLATDHERLRALGYVE